MNSMPQWVLELVPGFMFDLMPEFMLEMLESMPPWMWTFIQIMIVVNGLMLIIALVTLAERKIIGYMQMRHGPMRVGWHGLLQPIADGIKLILKEAIIPAEADKWLYLSAPVIAIVFALIPFAVVPFAETFYITDINIGIMFILAMSSVGFLGVFMGGWASGSKYPFLGSLRALALMISFEVPLVISMVGVILFTQSISLVSIVESQSQWGWFITFQPIAFVVYFLSGIAETQRIPFDMLEDDGSLVAGVFTEYSGMRFAILTMAEYANMFMISILAAVLFLGGWQPPFVSWPAFSFLAVVPGIFWFSGKVLAFMFIYIWLRATLPRVRYDQLMYLCWKILLPLSLINLLLTSLYLLISMNLVLFYILNIGSAGVWLLIYGKSQTWVDATIMKPILEDVLG